MKNHTERFLALALLFVLAGGLVIYSKWAPLTDHQTYLADIDVPFYAYVRLHNPGAFPNDLLADYSQAIQVAPGIKVIYFILTYFLEPLTVALWLWVIFLPLTCYFLFRLGQSIGGAWCGFLTGSLVLVSCWDKIGADTPGSGADFIMLFLAGITWALNDKRYGIAGVLLVLSSFFHPVPVMICLLALALSLVRAKGLLGFARLTRMQIIYIGATVIFCVGWNVFKYAFQDVHGFGEFPSQEAFYAMAEFGKGGIFPMVTETFKDWFFSNSVGLVMNAGMITLLMTGIFFIFLNGKVALRTGRGPWVLFIAGLLLFIAATVLMPRLFKPTRYFYLPSMLFLSCLVSYNFELLKKKLKSNLSQVALMIGPAFFLLPISLPAYQPYYVKAPDTPVYDYLKTVPDDSVIGAHPGLANHIPVFSKRSVLVTSTLSLPFYSDYYSSVKKRTKDFFKAYYSQDEKEVARLCEKYSLTHLVVSSYHFSSEYLKEGQLYFNPYNNFIKEQAKYPSKSYLLNLSNEKKLISYYFSLKGDFIREYIFHWNYIQIGGLANKATYEVFVTSCAAIMDKSEPFD